jgi:hypothetical protein
MSRFELQTLTDYSDEAILEELRRVATLHADGPLTLEVYRKLSPKVSSNTILRRFGSWRKALEAAGLTRLHVEAHMPYRAKIQRGIELSDDDLIAEMQRVDSLLSSGVLTVRDFNHHSSTHYDVVRKRFGSWQNALERAGVGQAELGKRYTDEQCHKNIISLWTHYGRQPNYGELKQEPSTVGPKAYVRRWGSWRKALAAFVEWANAEEQDGPQTGSDSSKTTEPVAQQHLEKLAKARLAPEDRHEVPLRLKWKVHLRDRFRCLACGKSPANDITVELHADHILPWADGGKTVVENLQTLCRNCNLGKGRTFGSVK